jgi:hypothetical protein
VEHEAAWAVPPSRRIGSRFAIGDHDVATGGFWRNRYGGELKQDELQRVSGYIISIRSASTPDC